MVALWNVDKTGAENIFGCGASLIAADWVVTAAHCVSEPELTQKGCYKPKTGENLLLSLGQFNIQDTGEGEYR